MEALGRLKAFWSQCRSRNLAIHWMPFGVQFEVHLFRRTVTGAALAAQGRHGHSWLWPYAGPGPLGFLSDTHYYMPFPLAVLRLLWIGLDSCRMFLAVSAWYFGFLDQPGDGEAVNWRRFTLNRRRSLRKRERYHVRCRELVRQRLAEGSWASALLSGGDGGHPLIQGEITAQLAREWDTWR